MTQAHEEYRRHEELVVMSLRAIVNPLISIETAGRTELEKVAQRDRLATYALLKRFKVPEQHRRMIFD